jgi:thiosulfate/3-mercaptopyruvate sulfurtransferase
VFSTLISVDDLAAHLDDADWIVFDCRHDLVDVAAGSRAYGEAHIRGARHINLDRDLSGTKNGSNGRHPLPDAQQFCARIAALGLRRGMQVVAYDASGGPFAARLWWMLRWAGHQNVAVLDGGWNAWLKAGGAVDAAAPVITPGDFTGAPRRRASSMRAAPTASAAKTKRLIRSAGIFRARSTVRFN